MPPMIDLDHLPYLGYFLAGLAVALGFGAYLSARSRARLPSERFSLLLCPAAAFLTLSVAVNTIVQMPIFDWNSGRLAPAVGLWYGAKLYVSPTGPGAVMDTIYPPMAYLTYVPAGLFSTPTSSIICASCISAALFFIPGLMLCFSRRAGEKGDRFSMIGVVLLLGLVQGALASKAMNWGAFWVHADAPMYGFAALACLALYSQREKAAPSLNASLLSALCISLSVWSKQTAAPLVMALPIWVLLTSGFLATLRYTFWLALVLASVSYFFRTIFGVDSMLFNIFTIPSSQSWQFQGPHLGRGLLLLSAEYFCTSAIFLAPIPLAMVARGIWTPEARVEAESEPHPTGSTGPRAWILDTRAWIRRNSWMLFVLMAFAAVPTSLLSRIKVGGAWNNYGPTPYFLSLGLMALLMDWHETNRRRGLKSFNAALTLILLGMVLIPSSKCSEQNFEMFKWIRRPTDNSQEQAYRFALRHPGEAYFPCNPLSTVLAEGELHHYMYGMIDRDWARRPISDTLFHEHIPANLRYVCFCPYEAEERYRSLMARLPEFRRRVKVPELPGWYCYER